MGIFNFLKKKSIKVENNEILRGESLSNKTSNDVRKQLDASNYKEFDITSKNNSKYLDIDSNDFVAPSVNHNDHQLFSEEDYINDLDIDTSLYDDLMKKNDPTINDQIWYEKDSNAFNISDDLNDALNNSDNVIENKIDYEFHSKDNLDTNSSDLDSNASVFDNKVLDNIENSDEEKKERDLFSYLDDPFLVDDFLNRDSFSFQKFLEGKKKIDNNSESLVDLDDDEQRLEFIKEIENNIINNEFQKNDLINFENINIEDDVDISSITPDYFSNTGDLEGDDLYKQKLYPFKSTDDTKDDEIIIDDIIIPNSEPIYRAPTNNFRDILEKDESLTSDNLVNDNVYSNYSANLVDDPAFAKDYIKNHSSLEHIENYVNDEDHASKFSSNQINEDMIVDFYDDSEVQPISQNTKKIYEDDPILNSDYLEIKEKMLINEIKQKYEKEIVMDAKRKQDEIEKINKRPNFNDELLDLIKKGYPN